MVLLGEEDHASVADAERQGCRLILLGKPGSGKGTQSKRIAESEGIPAISTGDLIRAAIAEGSELGSRFREYTEKGQLVPDELVLAMVEERLTQDDCSDGFLLDGFPRTVPQAEALEHWMDKTGVPLQAAINIDVPDEVLVERAAGRRFCPTDGMSYHVRFAPPRTEGICDHCGSELEQREDDREEVVSARIQEYRRKTEPLLDFYRARALLSEVHGVGRPSDVANRIESILHPAT